MSLLHLAQRTVRTDILAKARPLVAPNSQRARCGAVCDGGGNESFTTSARRKKMQALVAKRQKGLIVVLEHTYDFLNAAAVTRSCDAFGVEEILFVAPGAPPGETLPPTRGAKVLR